MHNSRSAPCQPTNHRFQPSTSSSASSPNACPPTRTSSAARKTATSSTKPSAPNLSPITPTRSVSEGLSRHLHPTPTARIFIQKPPILPKMGNNSATPATLPMRTSISPVNPNRMRPNNLRTPPPPQGQPSPPSRRPEFLYTTAKPLGNKSHQPTPTHHPSSPNSPATLPSPPPRAFHLACAPLQFLHATSPAPLQFDPASPTAVPREKRHAHAAACRQSTLGTATNSHHVALHCRTRTPGYSAKTDPPAPPSASPQSFPAWRPLLVLCQ